MFPWLSNEHRFSLEQLSSWLLPVSPHPKNHHTWVAKHLLSSRLELLPVATGNPQLAHQQKMCTQYPGMVGEQTKIHYLHTTTKVDITQAQWIITHFLFSVDKVISYELVVSLPRRCLKNSRWTNKVRWATSNQRFLLGFGSWWYAPHRPVVLWRFLWFSCCEPKKTMKCGGFGECQNSFNLKLMGRKTLYPYHPCMVYLYLLTFGWCLW